MIRNTCTQSSHEGWYIPIHLQDTTSRNVQNMMVVSVVRGNISGYSMSQASSTLFWALYLSWSGYVATDFTNIIQGYFSGIGLSASEATLKKMGN